MTPWQFTLDGTMFRLGFAYERFAGTPSTTYAFVWEFNEATKRWQRLPWAGFARLHPSDEGKFSYKEGRRRAVQRLLREVPFKMRPVLAQTFFAKGVTPYCPAYKQQRPPEGGHKRVAEGSAQWWEREG